MFFSNLTIGEFLSLLGALGGLITVLYLLDRARRKKVVSTLRFWTQALSANDRHSHKRVRDPWSLLLQLLSLFLLLLAIAQLQLGKRDRRRDYVLLLDTSSWTALRVNSGTLLDQEKRIAKRYVSTLAPHDRVLLVRVDALATPATSFTADHAQIVTALDDSTPGFSALNMGQALGFARQAQSWSGGPPGEIVYIGPARTGENEPATERMPNLRILPVPFDLENSGIRRIGVKRNDEDANAWQATISVKNYGSRARAIHLRTQFAGTRFAPRTLALKPGEETNAEYTFTTNAAGRLIAEIDSGDALPSDDRAELELPRTGALRIAVFTNRPAELAPLLTANHRLSVKLLPSNEYTPNPGADVMLLDRLDPAARPQLPSLWIEPPRGGSPLPVKTVVAGEAIETWSQDTALAAGLRAKEAHIPTAEVFQVFEGDIPVGSVAAGPVIVARALSQGRAKLAVIGFDPLSGPLKFEVTTPLLFANLLRWLAPEAFRTLDVRAGQVGTASVTLDASERPAAVHVAYEDGSLPPFTMRNRTLELFAAHPGIVRVISDDRERVLSLTLPDIAEFQWKPPANTASGVPTGVRSRAPAINVWQGLALLGGLALLAEWMLFGRRPIRRMLRATSGINGRSHEKEEAAELVVK